MPDRRREGVAGRLIHAAVTAAVTAGFTHIDLVTVRTSSHNAAMYTRRGWRELPADPGSGRIAVDDAGTALLWMRKHLTGTT